MKLTLNMRRAFRDHLGTVPSLAVDYRFEFSKRRISGENGWTWDIIETATGRFKRSGWALGEKADAEFDCALALRELV